MADRPLVLVVEDDRGLRGMLRLALQQRGYQVAEAGSGRQALAKVRESTPQLVLVDLGLPDISGVDLTWRMRREHDFPIIVLSARNEEALQIRAFDAGVNDYVTKPFREGELMARIRTALRYVPSVGPQRELRVGAVRLDALDRKVFVDDVEVDMTPTEFKLLHVLARDAGRVVTHRRLLTEVWGAGCSELQYLRVYMRHLRAKIEADATSPKRLLTVLGIGYRFAV